MMEGKKSLGNKILHFPLVKIIIGLLVCTLLASLGSKLAYKLLIDASKDSVFENLASNIAIAVFSLAGYILLYRYYESRRITEVSLHRFGINIGLGLLIGVGLQSLVILIIYLAGGFHVLAVNPVS